MQGSPDNWLRVIVVLNHKRGSARMPGTVHMITASMEEAREAVTSLVSKYDDPLAGSLCVGLVQTDGSCNKDESSEEVP